MGGVGVVIRDLPLALAERGCKVTVLIPAYGVFADEPGATRVATFEVPFGDTTEPVALFELPSGSGKQRQLVLDHARFAPREPGAIYCNDEADGPFATDAAKFAFFCAAAAAALTSGALPRPDVIHVHDWPGALFFLSL